ncbi:MAG: DNA polymerase III subunit alpha [Bacteroidaceae bacterium]|nr:DNA polymerase III subunit alpha [Bacteroidaceae bacterium]
MEDFIHLHVHTQFSLLDGQASIPNLVDKAIKDGKRGMAVTDHGNMMGIKDFFDVTNKKNGAVKGQIKDLKKKLKTAETEEEKEAISSEIAEAQKKLFIPIFGCEVYCARRSLYRKDKGVDQDKSGWHLILLAKNETGYHNLIKIVSKAWTEGFYMRPRTDKNELEKYHEGLIVCSACIGGEVPKKILAGKIEEAEEAIRWFKGIWGDDYYLEIQRHKATVERANHETYPLQVIANEKILELAKKYSVKVVCTNDVHFVDEENAEAHDRLICLSTGKDLDDPKRMLYTKQEWFKTKAEMNALFADVPESLSNTIEILNKIETYDIEHAPIMPNFEIPKEFGTEEEYRQRLTEKDLFDEFTQDENGNVVLSQEDAESKIKKLGGYDKLYRIKFEADYLKKLALEGAKRRYGDPLTPEVAERIKFELHIMKTMGFPGYFLIVQDFINAARKDLGVSVGPGRGSAAGSAVAYCLGITQIDPIQYDLLFERFLNPDRISLPDIDVDFDDDGRGKVLRWVTDKYGAEKVAHIITYGTMATKSAIKDVARVQKLPLQMSNELCKLVPDKIPDKKLNLANAIAFVPELQKAEASPDENVRNTLKYAKMLEGNVRNTGVHACGTIICRDDITDWVPVSTADDKETGEKVCVTQYDGHVIESTGLIKMDFLGLKTLSILKEAVENIRLSLGIDLDLDEIDINDPLTYQLYCDGKTIGTFQFESTGMQKYLRELQPSTFEDLIAMNALYRPGPMDYIPDFIARKQGLKPIEYDIPCMEKYLKDTYGITVYQEQVMLLSRQLADFTRGESDALRKAMGKKKKDIVDAMKPKFVNGGVKNGYDAKTLEKIWADWEKFASYAFNKSHATCYSWVAYQTAYLKANYPSQYMAAVMSRNKTDITEITKLMDECKTMNIRTLGPDLNESYMNFGVNHKGEIRFGLAAIKGVGESAVQAILTERSTNGLFSDIYNFVERINLAACNKKNMECLALAGAFDSFGLTREQYVTPNIKGETFLDLLVTYGGKFQQDKLMNANSLFGDLEPVDVDHPKPWPCENWTDLERLNQERDLVGIYLSAHPLDDYSVILNNVCNTRMPELADKANLALRDPVTMGGIVVESVEKQTKRGLPMGVVKIEDYEGVGELVLFGEEWANWKGIFSKNNTLFVTAKCEQHPYHPDTYALKIQNVEFLSEVKSQKIEKLTVTADMNCFTEKFVTELSSLLLSNPGNAELCFNVKDDQDQSYVLLTSPNVRISVNSELLDFIKSVPSMDFTIN